MGVVETVSEFTREDRSKYLMDSDYGATVAQQTAIRHCHLVCFGSRIGGDMSSVSPLVVSPTSRVMWSDGWIELITRGKSHRLSS